MASYEKFLHTGIALDPIHVGTGGARIGRVDLTIVRDPVTQVPKIPGSSLAGVYRTYVAMHYEEQRQQQSQSGQQVRQKPFYPDCAGLGLDKDHGHCRQPDCPVCTVFGFARGAGQEGGFAGLAAFSDAHVLLFPVPTRRGPMWVTSLMALEWVGLKVSGVDGDAVYLAEEPGNPLNLGWLLLETRQCSEMGQITRHLDSLGVPDYIRDRLALVPDRLFAHIVNSNLEVRTSVSINPETGAAEDKALFSYEALPRSTVLIWEIIAKNPKHFRINGQDIQAVDSPNKVYETVREAHNYLKHLGIGGMGTRGMGRVEVICECRWAEGEEINCQGHQPSEMQAETENQQEEASDA
ncbi:type III-B CRISPR module RAMP protein Cmr4 [Rhodothermus profundi]|uniref:CRISPR-associated protein Cmr4 n=1 Tax=Rhodothermus profundi TaxID=633813 RepID=A0A1M6UFI9_9BACT|nr:type III-B CRISPR module RAMP protein Cmr4 [Rhodothermus profundi]SHK67939.1 CRISPR-associated protein Cmr4 [Rhodothermus profundi]